MFVIVFLFFAKLFDFLRIPRVASSVDLSMDAVLQADDDLYFWYIDVISISLILTTLCLPQLYTIHPRTAVTLHLTCTNLPPSRWYIYIGVVYPAYPSLSL